MSDEETEDIDLSENDEVQEVEQEVEETEEAEEVSEVEATDWEAEAKKQKAINARLAKKLNRPAPVVEQKTSTNNQDKTSDSVDEKILRSTKDYSDDDIEKLRVVAKGLGVDLFKAEKDELFVDYLAKRRADERKEKAKLGGSNTSQVSQEREIGSMTKDEHQELFKEVMSKVN